MKKSSLIIESILTGCGIGFIVTVLTLIAYNGLNHTTWGLLVWLTASALFGVITALVFFVPNNLPFPAAMGIHFAGCTLVACAAAFLCGYTDNFQDLIRSFLPVFFLIYIIVYLVNAAIMKHNEKQINEALNNK